MYKFPQPLGTSLNQGFTVPRLVPSGFLCVLGGVREDWGQVEAHGNLSEGTKEK